jgi:hypothetical protein
MTAGNGFSRVVTGKKTVRQCDSATGRQSQQKGNAAKRGKCKTRKAGNARATSGSKKCERSRKVQKRAEKCTYFFGENEQEIKPHKQPVRDISLLVQAKIISLSYIPY